MNNDRPDIDKDENHNDGYTNNHNKHHNEHNSNDSGGDKRFEGKLTQEQLDAINDRVRENDPIQENTDNINYPSTLDVDSDDFYEKDGPKKSKGQNKAFTREKKGKVLNKLKAFAVKVIKMLLRSMVIMNSDREILSELESKGGGGGKARKVQAKHRIRLLDKLLKNQLVSYLMHRANLANSSTLSSIDRLHQSQARANQQGQRTKSIQQQAELLQKSSLRHIESLALAAKSHGMINSSNLATVTNALVANKANIARDSIAASSRLRLDPRSLSNIVLEQDYLHYLANASHANASYLSMPSMQFASYSVVGNVISPIKVIKNAINFIKESVIDLKNIIIDSVTVMPKQRVFTGADGLPAKNHTLDTNLNQKHYSCSCNCTVHIAVRDKSGLREIRFEISQVNVESVAAEQQQQLQR